MKNTPTVTGQSSSSTQADQGRFVPTRWSVVLAAGSREPRADEALETLCRSYWPPLYAYVRRLGHSPADAQDLTQEFFAQFLAHDWLAGADRNRGRFRSFLLMIFKRFLANQWDKARAEKRGGAIRLVPLSIETYESVCAGQLADTYTPEQAFEKQWALTVLNSVLDQLRLEYGKSGKSALFDALKASLVGSRETLPYVELAGQLGMTEGAVKVAVCRMRERYRELLRQEIVQTVASPDQVDAELRHLFRALARG